ncbi:MAG TPA: nickel pincer cofactor biosynthesis protein LarB [Chloroflexota bacterium]|nr:nickel pincer cofactor biosynthesis protein LarB [Chloroflexota bacterium]
MRDPMQELREALEGTTSHPASAHPVHLDLKREQRTGVPEIIQASGKEVATVLAIVQTFLDQNSRAILSRVGSRMAREIREYFVDYRVDEYPRARMLVVRRPDSRPHRTGGRVGIITAGSSDAPYAEEAKIVAEEMGCTTDMIYDVGVAGLHRLVSPLHRLLEERVNAIIVAAGMDGALPSVIAGLVDVPVIGLPTATGYGIGGRGLAALMSMLQTCVPGLTVVNVNNGIGAGACAARIANAVALARSEAGEISLSAHV